MLFALNVIINKGTTSRNIRMKSISSPLNNLTDLPEKTFFEAEIHKSTKGVNIACSLKKKDIRKKRITKKKLTALWSSIYLM
jgi:hypothetical protein